jgi:CRISPR-associated protein Cas2
MFITVSYDISDDRRRNRVLNILKDYGTHVQYSVFECNLTQEQLNSLKKRIESVIKIDEDNVRFYLLCDACKDKVLIVGQGILTEDEEVYVV